MSPLKDRSVRDLFRRPRSPREARSGRRALIARAEGLEERALLSVAPAPTLAEHEPGQVLIQFRSGVARADADAALATVQGRLLERLSTGPMQRAGRGGIDLVSLPEGSDIRATIDVLGRHPAVEYAQPNYIYRQTAVNDPYYTDGSLWGMYGDATSPTNQYGSQAGEAWDRGFTGSDTVYVGVIDTGVQYTHPDLDGNFWLNPFDAADGIDNDGNGFVDDTRGWDFYHGDNTVFDGGASSDPDDHGTHTSGTIGAEADNGIGVVGVNHNVTLISAKFLGGFLGSGSTANAIKAFDYFTDLKQRHGLNIVATNNSWSGTGFDQSLLDAIVRAANEGILTIAAASNEGVDNDTSPHYPANYNTLGNGASYEAIISVAAITSAGGLASFSNYGDVSVDLGAPGDDIWSTTATNTYSLYDGTSMATPHVTGAAALYKAANPGATAQQIRDAILNSVTATTSLAGKTVTGGRLNIDALMGGVALPSLSIGNASVTEGNSGTVNATFTVTLSAASAQTVTVSYATADGTATAGSDYTAITGGTLTFAPNETSKTVTVAVTGDTVDEVDETFFVDLSGAANATLADAQGQGTIVDDDVSALPSLTITDRSANEGRSGNTSFAFTVTLSAASTQTVTVSYATANGTALSGSDYTATSGTLTFTPGQVSKTVTVQVKGDKVVEPNETFFVNLSGAVNATLADAQGVGTIVNDDGRAGAAGSGSGDRLLGDVALSLIDAARQGSSSDGLIAPPVRRRNRPARVGS